MIIWCTDCGISGELEVNNGTDWTNMIGGLASGVISSPIVTTIIATSITSTSVISGGNVTSEGSSAITSRGVCWSTSASPTTLDTVLSDTGTFGIYSSNLTNLSPDTVYHLRAYAINDIGTAYGDEIIFTTAAVAPTVGGAFQGGILGYVFIPGDSRYVEGELHGLIVANQNQSTRIPWANGGSETPITVSAIGSGLTNTNAIVSLAGTAPNYAAKISRDYNGGGFTDWFLPSREELSKLFYNYSAYNFTIVSDNQPDQYFYWTSTMNFTPSGDSSAYTFALDYDASNDVYYVRPDAYLIGVSGFVRAVRYF